MFCEENQQEPVTLTEPEDMAVALGKDLSAFLLEEHVAAGPASVPAEASTTCRPKCGPSGKAVLQKSETRAKTPHPFSQPQ